MKTIRFLQFLLLLIILLVFNCKKDQEIPVKPTDLTLTVISQAEIDLAWKDNSSNETGFKIERSPDGSSGWTDIKSTAANVVTYKNTGLTAATIYYFRVFAFNSAGNSADTDPSNATTMAASATVTTNTVSSITANNATGGGNITSDGGSAVTARGVCWGTSANPTTADNKTTDGSGTGTYTSSIIGLTASTLYYVRAYATNSVSTAYGDQVSFTTSASATAVPTLSTTAITSIAQTTASGGGNITSDGGASVTVRGVCWNTSHNPDITNSKTSGGTGTGIFTSSLTGLTTNTTYYVRAYATNSVGTAYGNEQTFTTAAATLVVPTLSTTAITAITQTTASGGGNITSDGGASVTAYGVCWSTSLNPTTSNSITTDGTGTGSFTSTITGLTQGMTYHVRAYATNSAGTAYGSDVSFATLCTAPAATTNPASGIGTASATLNGTVNANGSSTTVTFDWGTTTGYGNSATASQSPVTGSSSTAVSAGLTGLTPNTLYHFRLKTVNCGGTTYGSDLSFTTSCAAPTAASSVASAISTTSATLNGTVNANNFSTTVAFDYGTTTGYGNSATASQSPVTGSSSTAVSAGLTGLTTNTLYHFRLKTVNCGGTTYGSDLTFTTSCAAPTATSNAASAIATTSATLNGTVNANYGSTTVTFDYGTTTSYGSTATASQSPVTGSSNTAVSVSIGLSPGTQYHYRIRAVNCAGTTLGSDQTFATQISDYDGNAYDVVIINSQLWSVENLKVTVYNDGSNLIQFVDTMELPITYSYYHYYNNNSAYNTTYGKLYNGYVVNTSLNGDKNICPTGWHVATDNDWSVLVTYLGGTSSAGGKMKMTGTSFWTSPNTGADNSSGFTALGGGGYTNTYVDFKNAGYWWSSNSSSPHYVKIIYSSAGISLALAGTNDNGFYIRCKK